MDTVLTRTVRVGCPYCGNLFNARVEIGSLYGEKDFLINCDIEETPGCDRQFVCHIRLEPVVWVTGIKDEALNISQSVRSE